MQLSNQREKININIKISVSVLLLGTWERKLLPSEEHAPKFRPSSKKILK